MTPAARVSALLEAARRVFGSPRDPALIARLAEESGLHPTNVVRALDRSLELAPHPDDVATMLACAEARSHDAVLVLLAANVFVAPFRALAWALAQSERVLVRTSRRASTFTDALLAACPLGIERVQSAEPDEELARLDLQSLVVHAYGGRATIEAVARRATRSELHGPGFGVIVAEAAAIAASAGAIAEDVALFDQRGCLSPRLVLSIGAPKTAALHEALSALDVTMPRGELTVDERAELARARDAALFAGTVLEGSGHLVVESATPFIGPSGRLLTVCSVASLEAALDVLRSLGPDLSTVGTTRTHARAIAGAFPRVRLAALGAMQSPPLDGPVDRRVWMTERGSRSPDRRTD